MRPIRTDRCRTANLRGTLIALAALGVVLTAAFFTVTYAAYFAIAAMCALFACIYWSHRSIHFLLIALVAGLVFHFAGGFDWVIECAIHKATSSSGIVDRKTYMLSTIGEFARDSWTGAGFYTEEEFSENFYRKRAHNTGLQAWSNLALLGFIVFMTMMIMTFTQPALLAMARARRRSLRAAGAVARDGWNDHRDVRGAQSDGGDHLVLSRPGFGGATHLEPAPVRCRDPIGALD